MSSPLLLIADHPGKKDGITLYLKRDDLLHRVVPGSKWRKLEPVIREVQNGKYEGILTFGGPFSNHIHAVAAAAQAFGFPAVAVLRGLHADLSNPTLSYAQNCGMTLIPISKQDYDAGSSSAAIQEIGTRHPSFYHLPEGGATPEAIRNCTAIAREILEQTPAISPEKRFIAVPAGTGTTAAGVIAGLDDEGTVLVFPAAGYGVDETCIKTSVEMVFGKTCPAFEFRTEYLFGGFAAYRPELIDLIRRFKSQTGVLLDPIYTCKMIWGIFDLLEQGYFPQGSVITALHTGGLQGWDGFRQRFGGNDESFIPS